MHIAELLIFILGCTGLTVILVSSTILESARGFVARRSGFLGKLINCPMCLGFWVGLFGSYPYDINHLWAASIVSLLSWSISNIIDFFYSAGLYFETIVEAVEADDEEAEETDDEGASDEDGK